MIIGEVTLEDMDEIQQHRLRDHCNLLHAWQNVCNAQQTGPCSFTRMGPWVILTTFILAIYITQPHCSV